MVHHDIIPNLFRTESSKITAVLCKVFGIAHIEAAEDIVSETFQLALETWPYKGVPENPTAWLYAVAKNKFRNYLHRNQIFKEKVAEAIKPEFGDVCQIELDLTPGNITDSQLQMLFAVCHPAIPAEAQIALALRVLCGFGIDEIATAFLTTKDTINKRIFRAKEKLRTEKVKIEFPAAPEINQRLDTVLSTLYLLYSEGYYSESHECILREDLCAEAMRLTSLLIENEQTNIPRVNALLSLMYFQSSRFAARRKGDGVVLYEDQDESLWDHQFIAKGALYLKQASQGKRISKYHLEAIIAYWHTVKEDTPEKWESILQLYNLLLQVEYSPIAALNRTFALSKANGVAEAIVEAEKLNLTTNHYYHTLLGELYREVDPSMSLRHLKQALALAKTAKDKQTIQYKIDRL